MSTGRQMRHHGFRFAARDGVAAAIGKARHGGGLGDVNPLRVGAGRIESDAERIIETGRKYEFLRRLAAIRTQDGDTASPAFGNEYVAVRRSADNARPAQSRGEQTDRKAWWYARRLVGALHESHHVGYRLRRLRRRQIRGPNSRRVPGASARQSPNAARP